MHVQVGASFVRKPCGPRRKTSLKAHTLLGCQTFHSGINGPGVKQIGRYLMNFSVDVTSEVCVYRVVPMTCFFLSLETVSINILNRLKSP